MTWEQLLPFVTPAATVLSAVVSVVWACASIKAEARSATAASNAAADEVRKLRADLRRATSEMRTMADRVLVLETLFKVGGTVETHTPESA
jgi:hypothetical protein